MKQECRQGAGDERMAIGGRARALKIALIAASMEILGGQAVQAHIMLEGLRRDGYEVDFIPINPPFPSGLQFLRRYPYVRTCVNEAFYIAMLSKIRQADVVHVFSASYWSFVIAPLPAMLAAKSFGKRVVLNYHSGEAEDHLSRWGALVHPWLRLADEIVVPSEYLREVFADHGYHPRVIPNVVDTRRFRYRERATLRPRLLSTRNLEPIYRVDNTIRAFALLKSRYPDASLTIAGYGSDKERLDRLAASTEGIRFVGRVEPSGVSRLYDEADVFVNSSVVDNQPLSVLEAFAAGVPVVSTPTGEIAKMVRDGETGSLVAAEDPSAMVEAITRLLEYPQHAQAMARRARKEIEKYTWARIGSQWAEVYSETL